MIEVRYLTVRSFDLDHLDVFWEIVSTALRRERFDIFVERSVDGPAGPFLQIAGPFNTTDRLRDPDVNQLHNYRKYFYRLKIADKDSGEEAVYGPECHEAEPDLIALELRRRIEFMLDEHGGRKSVVFPVLTSGFRCPNCYDQGARGRTIGRQLTSNCASCFDATYVGGYQTPIMSLAQFDPNPKGVVRTDTYERTPEDTTARLSSFPPLKPKDMIVEAENIRWEVQRVPTTKKGRAGVHQEPVLHRIPRSDIRYKVPVNMVLQAQFSAEREFTRPMCLQDGQGQVLEGNLGSFLDTLMGGT